MINSLRYLLIFFIDNKAIHNYNTRNKDDLHIFSSNTSVGSKSLKYKTSIIWNKLPDSLKTLTVTKSFKTNLKIHLRDNYSEI